MYQTTSTLTVTICSTRKKFQPIMVSLSFALCVCVLFCHKRGTPSITLCTRSERRVLCLREPLACSDMPKRCRFWPCRRANLTPTLVIENISKLGSVELVPVYKKVRLPTSQRATSNEQKIKERLTNTSTSSF